jgi:hypothetical protein
MCRKRFVISAFVLALLPTLFGAADRRELMGSWEGAGYHLQLPGSGGVAPYRWRVSDGQLPPGMKMDEATGVLSADSLEKRGTYDFSVALTDAAAKTVSENLRVVVLAPVDTRVPLQIMTESLPTGIKGQSYNVVIATRGGVQPVSCSASAALPQGLAMDSKTCRLYGAPTRTGDVAFKLAAQDSNATPARIFRDYHVAIVEERSSIWIFLAGIGVVMAFLWFRRRWLANRCPIDHKHKVKWEKDGWFVCPSHGRRQIVVN